VSYQYCKNMNTGMSIWAESLESYCSIDSFSAFFKGSPRKPKTKGKNSVNTAFNNIERYIAKTREKFERIRTAGTADTKDLCSADNVCSDKQYRGRIAAKPRYIERVYRESPFARER